MDVPRIGSTLLLPLLLVAGGWAAAQQVYKHVMPDGRVIYSDQPIKGADKTKTVDVPPPPSEAERAAAAQRAQQQNKARDDLQERLDQRRKTLDEADAAVQAARRDLADAEAALERGREPLPGERLGNVGPTTRLSPGYLQRVAGLEQNVERAKKALEDALKARNDAR